MSGRGSGSGSSSKKTSKSGASGSGKSAKTSSAKPQPIAIPRQASTDTYVPLSMSFTRNDIMGAIHRQDSDYPKVGENESANSLNGDFGKFLPPHVIGQRQREKEIARSFDKHSRRRYQHHLY